MTDWIETLEGRALFSAAAVPSVTPAVTPAVTHSMTSAYTAVLADDATIRQDARTDVLTLHAQEKRLAADVKALGRSRSNAALLKAVDVAANKTVASVSVDTARYLATAGPAFRRLELAQSKYAASGTAANLKRLTTAETGVEAVEGKQLNVLVGEVDDGGVSLSAALAALAAANPSAGTLDADLQSAGTIQDSLSSTGYAHLSTAEADISALLGTQFEPV